MFTEIAEQLPHALAITDMKTPGLPVTACNQAMVTLTGYGKEHTVGRNCRFLQGKRTEAAAVRAMVAGIRGAKVTTVRVTNYRKDGSQFTNMLTLSPVMDTNGEYRYNIGVVRFEESRTRERMLRGPA
jgi:PAS domain S-box-containing protein